LPLRVQQEGSLASGPAEIAGVISPKLNTASNSIAHERFTIGFIVRMVGICAQEAPGGLG